MHNVASGMYWCTYCFS